jgi:hypothetical protein
MVWQPKLRSQGFAVQSRPSLQSTASPPTQRPREQPVFRVQALPSSQGVPIGLSAVVQSPSLPQTASRHWFAGAGQSAAAMHCP